MGSLQVAEALKILLGIGENMSQRLLIYDALACAFRTVKRVQDPACPLCGESPTITELVEHQQECCPGGVCEVDQQ
jgi:adenylyltransferase/sulfurtransferase